jgi:hypothetical protein
MDEHPILRRYPEFKEFLRLMRSEVQNSQRPANEIIYGDQDVMRMLKISKRKLDYMKANREIPFHQPRPHSSCYYVLSDILEWLKRSRVESIDNERKF